VLHYDDPLSIEIQIASTFLTSIFHGRKALAMTLLL
jgi:hypothetical protein